MADLTEILAVRVRQIRNGRGWTQEELADRVGLSVRYIGQVERCQASPTVSVLGRLAGALEVEPETLLKRMPKSKATKQR
jgi:transcriptional regulator with XRE-family HTH domain